MTHANDFRLGRGAAADVGNNEGQQFEDRVDISQDVAIGDDEVSRSVNEISFAFFSLLYLVRKDWGLAEIVFL